MSKGFIATIAPYAVADMTKTTVLASITIAQSCLETGYGEYVPNGNYFGVKGSGNLHTTQEYIDGKWINIEANFASYGSMEASVIGHSQFLIQNPRYAKAGFFKCCISKDYIGAAKSLQTAGYATDPNYADKLIGIIEKYELHKFDAAGDGDEMNKVLEYDQWAWDELNDYLGSAYNDDVLDEWKWVQQVRNKTLKYKDLLLLKVIIDERRRFSSHSS